MLVTVLLLVVPGVRLRTEETLCIEVCVDNENSGDDDHASASRQKIWCNDQGSVGGINSGDGDQASVDRQNSGEDDQVSVGGINSGDGDQASVDRQNSGEDDQVSVGGQDTKDCDEACQAGPNDLSLRKSYDKHYICICTCVPL